MEAEIREYDDGFGGKGGDIFVPDCLRENWYLLNAVRGDVCGNALIAYCGLGEEDD